MHSAMMPAGKSRRAALLLLSMAILLLSFLIPYLGSLPLPPFVHYLLAGFVAAIGMLSLLFVPAVRVGHLDVSREAVGARLARELRRRGLTVAEKEGELAVHLGRLAAARVLVSPSAGGTEARLANGATTSGWGTLATLIVLVWTSWLAVAVMLYVHFRVETFLRRTLEPLLAAGLPPATRGPKDEIGEFVVDGLAEAHRLAQEAFEASRDVCHGWLALAVLGAVVGWFLVFLVFNLTSQEIEFGQRLFTAILLASGVAGALGAGGVALARRWCRVQVVAQRDWAERLREAWLAEAAGDESASDASGPFELLLEASREVPRWIRAIRRAGMHRDPASWMLVFALLFTAWSVASFLFFDPLLATGAMVGLVLAAGLYYRSWRRQRDAELAREQAEWDGRYEELRMRMERYLEGV